MDGNDVTSEGESPFERGRRVRREVLGDAHVDAAEAERSALDRDFQRFITETAWGEVWSRPDLDRRTRSLVTIGILAALGRQDELAMHLRASKNTGVSTAEVREALFHVALYAGLPAAHAAFSLAKRELEQGPGRGGDA
ncbi:MAG: 4-carboxymuconolactone decarboxylase [Actinobacteria bacterium]|nr:4-carboxymuconolactone decarboxylase [Actinomycetota bacterium]